jgi:YD repeat-containing protein
MRGKQKTGKEKAEAPKWQTTCAYHANGNLTGATFQSVGLEREAVEVALYSGRDPRTIDRMSGRRGGDGCGLDAEHGVQLARLERVDLDPAAIRGGDLVKVTDPLSRSSTMYYDDAGWLRSSTDALGNRTVYSYDPVGRITSVTDPAGNSVSYGYDLNGNMTSSTDQRNNPTTYAYDALNRRISRTDSLHATETFSYAPNGLLDTFTARNGQMTKRTYDTANRLSFIGFGATAQAPTTYESTISYAYDKGDRMLSAADSVGGTIGYTYDGLDRMTQETTPLGTVQYSYDNAGRRTEMRPTQQQPVDSRHMPKRMLSHSIVAAVGICVGASLVLVGYLETVFRKHFQGT